MVGRLLALWPDKGGHPPWAGAAWRVSGVPPVPPARIPLRERRAGQQETRLARSGSRPNPRPVYPSPRGQQRRNEVIFRMCLNCAHLIGYPCQSSCAIQCDVCGRDDRYGK